MGNIQPPIIERYQQYKFLDFNKKNIKYPKQCYTLAIKGDYSKEEKEKFFDVILALISITTWGSIQLARALDITLNDVKNLLQKNEEILNSLPKRIIFQSNNKNIKIQKDQANISSKDFCIELLSANFRDHNKLIISSSKTEYTWLMEPYSPPTIGTRDATFQPKKILSNDLNNNQSMKLTKNKEVYSPTSPSMNNFTNDSYPLINPNLDTNNFNLTDLQNFSADNALYPDINYPGEDGTINPLLLLKTPESFFQTSLTTAEKLEEINDGRKQFTL